MPRRTANRYNLTFVLATILSSVASYATETSAPASPEPPSPDSLRRLAQRIEPSLEGRAERLPQYIHFFSRELANDNRICAFDVTASVRDGKRIELNGFVEFPETRAALKGYLKALGFDVVDRMEELPSHDLEELRFAIVKSAHTYSFDRPNGRRKQENDCLVGDPLLVLRSTGGELLAHSREGYLGYVPATDVVRMGPEKFAEYMDGPRVLVLADQKIERYPETIPAGARLKLVSDADDTITVALPTGDKVKLSKDACKVCEAPTERTETIISSAKRFIGTPYFWGGRTSDGIDCSGLVQMGFASAGLHLPRDAYQQFYVGQLTGTRWHTAGMRRGDTLYFLGSDGKIRHTAIYLGEKKYLEAVMPKVRISSFNPSDAEYDADRHASFAFAKRLLD